MNLCRKIRKMTYLLKCIKKIRFFLLSLENTWQEKLLNLTDYMFISSNNIGIKS